VSYLVDSDWVIDALAGVPSALSELERLSDDGLAISIITFGEVLEGAYLFPDYEAHLQRLMQFLSGFRLVGLSEGVMEQFAQLRHELRQRGQLIPDFDLLIASTAIHYGLTLMTRNIRHFSRIADLELHQQPK